MLEQPAQSGQINFPTWSALGTEAVVVGHVESAGAGRYRVTLNWSILLKAKTVETQFLIVVQQL